MRLMGGLGNQMFQYALGRRLALDRKVPLKLDITTWYQIHSNHPYGLDNYTINAQIAPIEEINKFIKKNLGGFGGKIYRNIQKHLSYYKRRIIDEKYFSFDDGIINKTSKEVYLNGFWQSEKYFAPISTTIRDEFSYMGLLSPQARSCEERIKSCMSISLHVRRGDYVSENSTNQIFGICSINYYQNATKYLFNIFPDAKLFIFSDDISWVRQNLSFLPAREFIELRGKKRDIEELKLMSLCKHHIVANSSFSWWGAWLNPSSNKVVIAPDPWFNKPGIDTCDLYPNTWIKMQK